MKTPHYLRRMSLLAISLFVLGCSSDDDNSTEPQLQAWEVEVNQLKNATSQYIDFSVAENEGRIDVSGFVPNMGHHYLNPALADGTFEINKPEIILYVPDNNGVMQMVGVEYSIIPADPNNPGSPPEGFTGDQDVWHFNDMIEQWQLHVWTVLDNSNGIFAPLNTAVGN